MLQAKKELGRKKTGWQHERSKLKDKNSSEQQWTVRLPKQIMFLSLKNGGWRSISMAILWRSLKCNPKSHRGEFHKGEFKWKKKMNEGLIFMTYIAIMCRSMEKI